MSEPFAPAASALSGTGVPLGPLPRPAAYPDAIPLGSVLMWPAAEGPDNWMICNGDPISREEYKELFAVIGTTYGTGDGSHTFNLPDMRDRMPVAKGANTGTDSLGETGGGTTHQHTVDNHTHTGPSHQHSVSGSTSGHAHNMTDHLHGVDHTHTVIGTSGDAQGASSALSTQSGAGATRTGTVHQHAVSFNSGSYSATQGYSTTTGMTAGANTGSITDSFSVTSGAAGTGATGGATPNTNAASSYPPYLTLNFIIKVK